MLEEKRGSLERLLDLYLSGEYHKDLLIGKKTELEKIISDLEHEHARLTQSIQAQTISKAEERDILKTAGMIKKLLNRDDYEESIDARRNLIKTLKAESILSIENGEKMLRVKCILGAGHITLSPPIRD